MLDQQIIISIFTLLIAFQIKHVLADYFLQTQWMVYGKCKLKGWVKPLFAHASVHALLTLIIALIFAPALWWLCALDIIVHFIIDRIKANPRLGGRFKMEEGAPFWWAFGVDQMLHHLTHYFIIYVIIDKMYF